MVIIASSIVIAIPLWLIALELRRLNMKIYD
jgi:hypothetical protein